MVAVEEAIVTLARQVGIKTAILWSRRTDFYIFGLSLNNKPIEEIKAGDCFYFFVYNADRRSFRHFTYSPPSDGIEPDPELRALLSDELSPTDYDRRKMVTIFKGLFSEQHHTFTPANEIVRELLDTMPTNINTKAQDETKWSQKYFGVVPTVLRAYVGEAEDTLHQLCPSSLRLEGLLPSSETLQCLLPSEDGLIPAWWSQIMKFGSVTTEVPGTVSHASPAEESSTDLTPRQSDASRWLPQWASSSPAEEPASRPMFKFPWGGKRKSKNKKSKKRKSRKRL